MSLPPKPAITAFLKFARERQNIYERRKAGKPWPWTKDKILQEYKFCNVFREQDTVTIWIDKNVRKRWAFHKDLWWMLAACRLINWPDTLEEIIATPGAWPIQGLSQWKPAKMRKVMLARGERGEKVYTGAYMLRGGAGDVLGDGSVDKAGFTTHCLDLMRPLGTAINAQDTLEEVFGLLSSAYNIGPFLAYEITTDLRHTPKLRKAKDINTFANAGPGAIRGLSRLHGREKLHTGGKAQTLAEMIALLPAFQAEFKEVKCELRDVEHTLCEFDKYERVRLGQGRPRAKYTPPE